jgi:hypothetical protein
MALSFRVDLDNLWVGTVDTDPEPTAELDVSKYVGNIFINVAQIAGGSDTLAVTVQHSLTSGGTFAAVPAAALFNPETGNADTFTDLGATASDETLYLNRQQLKRYVRVLISDAANFDHIVSVTAGAMPVHTEQ